MTIPERIKKIINECQNIWSTSWAWLILNAGKDIENRGE